VTFGVLLAVALLGADRPCKIQVVDDRTGRGVPLVELRTVDETRYYTDSAGVVAFDEPGLMGIYTYFHVKSHGYEVAADGFGNRGVALTPLAGGSTLIKIKRVNIAERLYRVTGGGIYRDSVMVGDPVPIRQPLLNGLVLGSDSVLNAVYGGKLWWFWGDTNKPSYPLGNFHTPGATSRLPADGGLDPDLGVDLEYLVDPTGFARPTAELPGPGPTWLFGLVVLKVDGRERMFAGYSKIKGMLEVYERGLVEFDPGTKRFHKVATFPKGVKAYPDGHSSIRFENGVEYVYFSTPFPVTRVPATPEALADPSQYEVYSAVLPDGMPDRSTGVVAHYAWRKGVGRTSARELAGLVLGQGGGFVEDPLALKDIVSGATVWPHSGSTEWNEYRRKWVVIAVQEGGRSFLGEVWYAEADTPLGPWSPARRVVTHQQYSFYNPRQHPEFAKRGGRDLFFEGTYTATFSGNLGPTPRYDYNQVMYKLDLDDPSLRAAP